MIIFRTIKYLLVVISLLLYSTLILAQNNYLVSKTYFINKNLPLYEFKLSLIGIDSVYNQQEYDIQISTEKIIVQNIFVLAMDKGTEIWLDDSLQDVNFDGYNDLLISSFSGEAGKNQFYDCWLFDADSAKFVFNTDFSGLCNVLSDTSQKRLYVNILDGCASQCYDEIIYKVVNNKPIVTEKRKQYYDFETGLLKRFIETYSDGELISKKEVKPTVR